ncbi:RHS repeat-associated core domain-containing protein [Kribbella sp. NPDC056951]|uniref:RHS repeat-associated core domain-containing protein n=1 Tax=Kribbella sp. NPDC056951 TaxID=3345978 RepID=UPI003644C5E8
MRIKRRANVALVTLLGVSLLAGTASYVPEAEAKTPSKPAPGVQAEKPARGTDFRPGKAASRAEKQSVAASRQTIAPTWPSATTKTIGAVQGQAATPSVKIETSPVSVSAVQPAAAKLRQPTVKVDVLDQAASTQLGIEGVVIRLQRTDAERQQARVKVSVDYSKFAGAFGGGWSDRLRLVELSCSASGACAHERVLSGSVNDTKKQTVGAEVDLSAPQVGARTASGRGSSFTTLAVTAGASGSTGSYAATPLSASSTWNVSVQTGDFSWNYPLRVPPGTAGPRPDLSIGYSSGSVDGQVASSNNQTSWVGEGHSLEPGFIERKYVSCADDMTDSNTTVKTGDLCWKTDNAVLSLAGHSGELVKFGDNQFKLRNDDGSRIERLYDAGNASGAKGGEHWLVTTSDGTKYYFGSNAIVSGTDRTDSVNTVPVFGNQIGEPCRAATFAKSFCQQAWRWNLDRVIDVNGNLMRYRYIKENNNYGRNNNEGASQYQRASYPWFIDYGKVTGSTETTTVAPARVWFDVAERCLPGGAITCAESQLTAANAYAWPDVPFDQICTSASTCPNRTSPAFFTRKRLTKITTGTLKGSSFSPVDSWALTQDYPPSGNENRSLFLRTITHTGHVGGTLTNPPVSFAAVDRPNRVDALGDGAPAMTKWRIGAIESESGQITNVNYSNQHCTPDPKRDPVNNTLRCFPVYWTIDGGAKPTRHWFNKYVVTSIVVDDQSTDAPDQGTFYDYLDDAAWHYDDNELTVPAYRSWGDWRGYSKVAVRTGGLDPSEQTRTEYLFFRGMNGDFADEKLTTRKNVSVTDSQNSSLVDSPRLNGVVREQISYNGVNGPVVSASISTPWTKQATSPLGGAATLLQAKSTSTRTRLSDGSYQTTAINSEFDDLGMVTEVEDAGDVGNANDDKCTRITYNRGAILLTTVSREETVSVGCEATPERPAEVVSDERTYYDGHAGLNDPPTQGLITKVESLSGWSNGPVYEQRSRTAYDTLGRVLSTWDGLNRLTSEVTFTPATGGPVTGRAVKDAKGFVNSTLIDPAFGATIAEIDQNGRRTDLAYDAFGRLTGVWLPNRSKSAGVTASMIFGYSLSKTKPNVVTSQELKPDGTYKTSKTLFDGQLRQRQVQTPAATGVGRVMADTTYDRRGNVKTTTGAYYESKSGPSDTLFDVDEENLPSQTVNTYDGANRLVLASFEVQGHERWRTQTSYGGNTTTVIPPTGGTTTTQVVDARGQLSELRQYRSAAASGQFDSTKYTYTPDGQLETVTNAEGSVWRYTYDLRGRQISAVDPDKGTTTSTYDKADRVTSTKDARGQQLFVSYDELDRKTAVRSGSADGPVVASWVYDTLGKGLLTSSTRTIGDNNYVSAVNSYDSLDRPTATQVVIPESEGKLAGTYVSTTSYNPDGSVNKAKLPTTPGLPDETIEMKYDEFGNLRGMGGWQSYVAATKFSEYGDPLQYTMGQKSELAIWQSFAYEQGTRLLEQMRVDRSGVVAPEDTFDYTYDNSANVTSVSHTMGAVIDRQCFTNDYLRRTTEAWTPTGSCSDARSASTLGGPAPYWQSYTYDRSGNRTKLIDHKAAGDATSTFAYPAPTAPKPHAVTDVNTSGPAGTSTDTYAYDSSGNMASRTVGGDTDTFTWDIEGHLASVSGPAGDTSFVYDAEGSRLIRHDPKGATLYLPSAEVRWEKAGDTVTSTRYYEFNGSTVAMRNDSKTVEYLMSDPQGTASVSIDGLTAVVSRRNMDPFGNVRGTTSPTWDPNARGFVNGVDDPSTGLTHLGAREYDPKLGRFISVDPLLDVTDPITLNGYRYGNNNPATFSDPDGLKELFPDDPANDGVHAPRLGYKPPRTPTVDEVREDNRREAVHQVSHHKKAKQEAKKKIKRVVKDLVKIVADELGITDALNCFTDGDVGACISTGVTVLSSFVGGIAGKLVSKYLLHAKKAWKLIGRIQGLVDELIDGVKGVRKAEDDLRAAERTMADSCPLRNSFIAGTLVQLANGKQKPIDRLQVGDLVMAADPATGKVSAQAVVGTIVGHGVKELVELKLTTTDAAGRQSMSTLTATDGHPFYIPSAGRWVDASMLRAGDELVALDRSQRVAVVDARAYQFATSVYNLSVKTAHNYYVGAGRSSALVHNCGSETEFGQACTCDADQLFARFGTSKESTGRLARNAQMAEDGTPRSYGHGVSVTPVDSAAEGVSVATRSQIEGAGFSLRFTPTRNNGRHHTLILPKPVTSGVQKDFNTVFGRR